MVVTMMSRGYDSEEETGLYYLRNRYYRPNWCTFVNADSIYFGPNAFCYCENDPVSRCDPNGHESIAVPFPSRFAYDTYSVTDGGGGAAVIGLFSRPVTLKSIITNSWSAIANSFIAAGDWVLRQLGLQEQAWNTEIIEAVKAQPDYAVLEDALRQAKEKGAQSDKTPHCDLNCHHIIPQTASATALARNIWIVNCKQSIHAVENLVSVSTEMHWFMHKNTYYTCINSLISYAYSIRESPEDVRDTLALIKKMIQVIDNPTP